MPRILADGNARQLDIVELKLGNLFVADKVEHNNRGFRGDDESLAVGRYCQVIGAEFPAVTAKFVLEMAVEVPDAAAHRIVLRSDNDACTGGVPSCCRAWIGEVADEQYACASLRKLVCDF